MPGLEPLGVEYSQPSSSPYELPIATIMIGNKSYGIPVYYLKKAPQLTERLSWESCIELPYADEDIGHTLVHFL
ncbi:hypothetical protein BDV12DRAFT_203252 [Aspergillus spectabilis]